MNTPTTLAAAARSIAASHDVAITLALTGALAYAPELGRTPDGGWTPASNLTIDERDQLCALYSAHTAGQVQSW